MSSVSSSWRRIDAWLAAHAPVTLAMLNPSATAEAVESAQQVLGMRFPDELTESLKCHDGAIDWMNLFPEQQSPLSAAGIARQWQIYTETASDSDGFVRRPWGDEPWWHPRWIPWAETADGVAHIIDLRLGPDCGRLGWAGHDGCGDFSDSCPSLATYLREVSQALYLGCGVRGMYPTVGAAASSGRCSGADDGDALRGLIPVKSNASPDPPRGRPRRVGGHLA